LRAGQLDSVGDRELDRQFNGCIPFGDRRQQLEFG
jgi:hypothetical protein